MWELLARSIGVAVILSVLLTGLVWLVEKAYRAVKKTKK